MIYSDDPYKVDHCPYCKTECHSSFVDTYPGAYVQTMPYRCDRCKAYEIGMYDEKRPLTRQEEVTNWYKPGSSGEIDEDVKPILEAEFQRKVKLAREMWAQVEKNEESMAEMAAISATFEQFGLDDVDGWDVLHHDEGLVSK